MVPKYRFTVDSYTSRLFVKDLPKKATNNRLRDFFSQKGEVTDAKILLTSDGKSRKIAFVGFRTDGEAEAAMKYFNNSYLDTSKITCKLAHKIGDPNIPRSQGRHSAKKPEELNDKKKESTYGKSLGSLKPEREVKKAKKSIGDDDSLFQEFCQVTQPRSQSNIWANDTVANPLLNSKTSLKETESLKEGKTLTVKADTLKSNDDEMNESGNVLESENDEMELVRKTGRLFIRNLPYTATEDDLRELFQRYGDLSEAHLVLNKDTKRSKGFAYILYARPECAVRSLEELDHSIFQGRLLHILPAKQQHSSEKQEAFPVSQTNKSLKQQREDHKKESEAKGDTRAWNSLFMRSDTIVENAARKYGTSKSDFLDREADDLAVKIALAETQVIADTKKALANSGVNVAALEEFISGKSDAGKRSNHVVLVKNLPYGSSEGDLAKMFGKFGSIDRIILPPTKTLAFVVFLEAAEARGAFKGLAYKRYKDVPLYLEWAPNNILSPTSKSEIEAVIDQQDVKRGILEHHAEEITNDKFDPDRVESRTLVLKNLNFKTSDEGLRKHFSDLMKEGNINSVTIRKHLHHGKTVSRGFGFIEFDSADTAANVLNDLQGTILDGHKLTLQVSQAKKDGSTKLIVFNVSFEATKKDLRDLFGSFGKIKSLRLPMKFGNQPQGFAFVEFMTKKEAQHALEALSNPHLNGRHLVLEWAKEGERLEDLRARTATQFTDEQNGYQNPPSKGIQEKETYGGS
ncbi:hypothetical protein ACHQM5_005828 [Ranunculus cassubicifolius]